MKEPGFWREDGLLPRLLTPLGWCYALAGRIRASFARPYRAPIPVICIGNLTAGGAGKTPTAIAALRSLIAVEIEVHAVTRGYGGSIKGPHRVNLRKDGYLRVGDEPLLLAAEAPTWVARDRAAGIRAAVEAGAQAVVLDDGHQNPGFARDLSIVVIDGGAGFGNGRVIPAGPLRESVAQGLARADAVVLIGEPMPGLEAQLAGKTILRAKLEPRFSGISLSGRRVFAFAGIGRPEKFFATVRELGAELVDTESFPDHHVYDNRMINRLVDRAANQSLVAVTTEKDMVKLPRSVRGLVWPVPVGLTFDHEEKFDNLLNAAVTAERAGGTV